METYITNSDEINLTKRMDFNFWSSRKSLCSDYITKSIAECVGRNNLTASAFYPSIVPSYVTYDDSKLIDTEPFIRVADARNGLLNYNKTVFLSVELLDKNTDSIKRVHPKDIVITKGGEYIGETALVPDYYDEYATCRDILCIKTDNSIVSGEYLASFLQSSYGKSELIRTKSVQGQPHLTIDKVSELLVPIYGQDFQDEIAAHWDAFYELVDTAETHLNNARAIFDTAMNHKIDSVKSKIFFSEVMNNSEFVQRYDVDYYEKKWSNVVEELKKDGVLFHEVKYVKRSFKPNNPKEIFNYITLSDIDDRSGIVKNLNSMEAYKLPDRAKRMTQKGDVLVSSLKGSKEKIAIVNSELDNVIASTGFYVVRDDEYLPEVLYLIFRSSYYDLFIEQMSSGAIMSSITDKYFKQFLIPDIPQEIQSDIAEEISSYISVRKLAFQELNNAISKFDEMATYN